MWLVVAGPILGIAAIGLGVRIAYDLQHETSPWLSWVFLLALLLFAGGNLLAFRNETVFAGDGYIGETSWIGRRKRIGFDDVKSVIRLGVRQRSGSAPKIVVVGQDNHRLMVLDDRMWNDASLDSVWNRLGHQPEGSFDDVLTLLQFYSRYPKH
jgi:hypothetical protein